MKIRKGDTIEVIAGRDKGKRGRVDRVLVSKGRIVGEGINMVTRHVKPRPDLRQAGRIQQESSIHISNVMLVCNKCDRPTRVRESFLDDGRKVRTCKWCKETID